MDNEDTKPCIDQIEYSRTNAVEDNWNLYHLEVKPALAKQECHCHVCVQFGVYAHAD